MRTPGAGIIQRMAHDFARRVEGGWRTAGWLVGVLATACAPALDWRQVQPPGWSLTAALPCRPDRAERTLPLAGAPVVLGLWSCSADGHVFAIASADVAEPARVGPALQALAEAARANLAAQVESDQPALVRGMTPYPQARHLRLAGRRPDGQALREQMLVFARGTRVYQATVLGAQVDEARVRPLVEALELGR